MAKAIELGNECCDTIVLNVLAGVDPEVVDAAGKKHCTGVGLGHELVNNGNDGEICGGECKAVKEWVRTWAICWVVIVNAGVDGFENG